MKNALQPDTITKAACLWLLNGGGNGLYSGPDPGTTHGLSSLLSEETGRRIISLAGAAMWLRLEQTLKPVLENLAENELTVWAVKGFDLARSVYPFPGGRPMVDADLFMEEKDRSRIVSIFSRSRWLKGSPGNGVFTSGIVSEMKMFKQGVMAELHTHIFYFPATFPGKLPSDLYQGGRSLAPGLMGFAWHNALLMVILHLLTNTSIRPVWWVDVCLLCKKITEEKSWDKFTENALGTKLGSPVASILETARTRLRAPVPVAVTQTLQRFSNTEDNILQQLKKGQKTPTLLNLKHLNGWKRISWLSALFWLVLSRRQPLQLEQPEKNYSL